MGSIEEDAIIEKAATAPDTRTEYVYCLRDPETGEVRYVGKATHLGNRFSDHRGGLCGATSRWVYGLRQRGLKPNVTVLGKYAPCDVSTAELWWMHELEGAGAKLLNVQGRNGRDHEWAIANRYNVQGRWASHVLAG